MSKVSTVLLIPSEGDPHGLLSSGPCGYHPPVMWREVMWEDEPVCDNIPTGRWVFQEDYMGHLRSAEALVLRLNEKPNYAGCDRLARCTYEATDEFYREFWGDIYDPGRYGFVEELIEFACSDDLFYDDDDNPAGGMGRVIYLDDSGMEIDR